MRACDRLGPLLPTLFLAIAALRPAAADNSARVQLLLDDSVEEAHKVLGHELVGKSWMSPEEKETRVHRGEILEALDKAGRLDPELEGGPSSDERLSELRNFTAAC